MNRMESNRLDTQVIRHRIQHSEGGGQQTSTGSVMQRRPPGVTTTMAPSPSEPDYSSDKDDQ